MNKQNKNTKISNLAAYAGFSMLATAAVLSSIVAPQPKLETAHATERVPHSDDHHRHEETGPHYISYSNAQRTPARAASF